MLSRRARLVPSLLALVAAPACERDAIEPKVAPAVVEVPAGSPSVRKSSCPAGTAFFAGGTFEMLREQSCRKNGAGTSCDHVQAAVRVEPYCLDLTEVTADAFASCVRAGKCDAELHDAAPAHDALCNYRGHERANHPMNCVDWVQSATYCREQKRRLPTSAEWEWAVRAGAESRTYAWGSQAPGVQVCWSGLEDRLGAKVPGTCPVALFAEDGVNGVHDLAGNVSEWVDDEMHDGLKRIRGGNWAVRAEIFLRLDGDIDAQPPKLQSNTLGFRCAQKLG